MGDSGITLRDSHSNLTLGEDTGKPEAAQGDGGTDRRQHRGYGTLSHKG